MSHLLPFPTVGSRLVGADRCRFGVWGPLLEQVNLKLLDPERQIPMTRDQWGYWQTEVDGLCAGTRYFYQIEGSQGVVERPDPASLSQPDGVHGASEVVELEGSGWTDQGWRGIPLADWVVYELHIGTFTPEGSFAAAIQKLPLLKELGVNVIEVMPVAQCPGGRNWGYDGVYPYAVSQAYGGLEGFCQWVNACHAHGIAVVLDVVYNHLGPEGNYLSQFGPYFTDRYRTPWGSALNFDSAYCDGIRHFFIQNALFWLQECHVDGLRLDAVHAIYDFSARPFLRELALAVEPLSRDSGYKRILIGECDLNDTRFIDPVHKGGYGLDSQWCDEFHHALHTLLTGEQEGYYEDFGSLEQLAQSYRLGYVYTGEYSQHRRRFFGSDPSHCPGTQFVVCNQNHDQVGNRMLGDRLSQSLSFDALKLAAAVTILAPMIPLLFMGEEYGETAPFQYFVSHSDPDLVRAVQEGRKREFSGFAWKGEVPDPQSEQTFLRSKLDWQRQTQGSHAVLWRFYQKLIQVRRRIPALAQIEHKSDLFLQVNTINNQALRVQRQTGSSQVFYVFNLDAQQPVAVTVPTGTWGKVLDSQDLEWQGSGTDLPTMTTEGSELEVPAHGVVIYQAEDPSLAQKV